MRDQLRRLHKSAGSPTKSQLKTHADVAGHSVSRSALADVTVDRDSMPRWSTVEAFIDACARFARARGRPLAADQVDMSAWKALHEQAYRDGRRRPSDQVPFEHGDQAVPLDEVRAARQSTRAVSWSVRTGAAPPLRDYEAGTGGNAVLHGLPADTPCFTGRDTDMRRLVDMVFNTTASAGVGRIHAINGMAGIGKTAFAVHVAHRLAHHFPDGQIFLSLDAHTPERPPVAPAEALATLLLTRGFRPDQIPPDMQARSALWRDHLAGRRLLLILDDAASTEQVRALLPGTPSVLVLITSRRALTALPDAMPLTLDTLSPHEAAALFARSAARGSVTAEPDNEAVTQIVDMCACLPLAVSLLAGRLRHKPASWTAGDLVAELATAHDRLAGMRAEDQSISVAFELSHQTLPGELRLLFAQLGLHPGADIDVYATAALIDADPAAAAEQLDQLCEYHLLSEPARGRYRMHDLVRAYARKRCLQFDTNHRKTALRRLLDFYQQTAQNADPHMARHTPLGAVQTAHANGVASPPISDRAAAVRWMRTERVNLLACLRHAAASNDHGRVITLTAAVTNFLRQEGPWQQAVELQEAASAAAHSIGDNLAEANATRELGVLRRRMGEYQAAQKLHERAFGMYEQLGDELGQAHTLHHLSLVHRRTENYSVAAVLQERAYAIYMQVGDRLGQANALHDLGVVRRMAGDCAAAAALHERARELYEDLGDRHGRAHTLHHLGVVRRMMGDHIAAASLHTQAQKLYETLGDRQGQAHAFHHLGITRYLLQDYSAAVELHELALERYEVLGDRHGQAHALHYLGVLRRREGAHQAATELHRRAMALFRRVGDVQGESEELSILRALEVNTNLSLEGGTLEVSN